MYNLEFKKSIINIHTYYQTNNYNNDEFIKMIDKCFQIKKSTFYNWLNDKDIINANEIYESNNKLVNLVIETHILNLIKKNNNIGIKNIKKSIKDNFKISINFKTISYILHKNDIKHKNIKPIDVYIENKHYKKQQKIFINLNQEHIDFILKNKDKNSNDILNLFKKNFNLDISQKQIIDVMYKNKISIKSFYKSSPYLIEHIKKYINNNHISTINDVKENIKKEFNLDISIQFIYNILKKEGYVYKKFKYNNNQYSVEEQVKQFQKINKTHNLDNINKCVSIDEISFILNSKPKNGWFKKKELNEIHINNAKIIRERYTLLVASTNEKIINYKICQKGLKTDLFIKFMKELKELDPKNEKYYLLDNARVHTSNKFKSYLEESKMNMVYNAPYHSETNPIENIFSMFRNYLNRNITVTKSNLILSIDNFIKIDNKEKFNNIFKHSCNMIKSFIEKNKI